jgi:hypothetical protein
MPDEPEETPESIKIDRDMFKLALGMSLRDYFAAAVLMGIWARARDEDTTPQQDAADAYAAADAMLKVRKEGEHSNG